MTTTELIDQCDSIIRRDPARRGLIATEKDFAPLCQGHLLRAATNLAETATHVGLVTGFFVPGAETPAAETDGPLGTIVLAAALEAVGIRTTILTDRYCLGAVAAALNACDLDAKHVETIPNPLQERIRDWEELNVGRFSQLIAIERVGPSHTPESHRTQSGCSPESRNRFLRDVPSESHNRCHNMRGDVIDKYSAAAHRLFDVQANSESPPKTIGIGDGGNEIGMGSILWEELERRLDSPHAGRIVCRIATDWTIVAGTSNWGAYGLAAALLILRNRTEVLDDWPPERQQDILEKMVRHGPAVDGITGCREATVDGLPFLTYIQPWEEIRRLVGMR